MSDRLVAGIDSSTQSTKVIVRRVSDGAEVAEARAPHPATEPPRSEQDPRSWWQALVAAFSQLDQVAADIVGLSVSGQQHGLVLDLAEIQDWSQGYILSSSLEMHSSTICIRQAGFNDCLDTEDRLFELFEDMKARKYIA